jgi:hypothetical protein
VIFYVSDRIRTAAGHHTLSMGLESVDDGKHLSKQQ